ncbi:hypothetical protein pb186bvf_020733 [Paramecium bursaria]
MLSDEKERELASQEALKYLNQVRSDPKSLIPNLKELLTYFINDQLIQYPDLDYRLISYEGPAAVQECIYQLNEQSPVCELQYCKGLSLACLDHVQDIGPKGLMQHQGTDNSQPKDRVLRYGKGSYIGENISSGQRSGLTSIIDLLVDDNVPSRGHRKNIFVKDYKFVGIDNGLHKKYGFVFVYGFAGDYKDNQNLSKVLKNKQQYKQVGINQNKQPPKINSIIKYTDYPIKVYQSQNQIQKKSQSLQKIQNSQKMNSLSPNPLKENNKLNISIHKLKLRI